MEEREAQYQRHKAWCGEQCRVYYALRDTVYYAKRFRVRQMFKKYYRRRFSQKKWNKVTKERIKTRGKEWFLNE